MTIAVRHCRKRVNRMRLIDADYLKTWFGERDLYTYDYIIDTIDDVPTVKPEPHWIPCSERLPQDEDYDETFAVTIQCEHVDGWDDYVTGYADWTPHGWDIQSYYLGQIKVTAWMPLPEPWKGEEE